jgi:endonuclease III related protein
MARITRLYRSLLAAYGLQGWWPLLDVKGTNPTKTGSVRGYHPGDYSYPRTDAQRFEICVGAILTQNTAWSNVEKALVELKKAKALSPNRILSMKPERLEILIRPAGYFRQKAKKLRLFAEFYMTVKKRVPSREELLALWGIGPETADSMLNYAYKVPTFVMDAYTRRVFLKEGLIWEDASYDDIKELVEQNLPHTYEAYQEFHALLVEHAKRLGTKDTPGRHS